MTVDSTMVRWCVTVLLNCTPAKADKPLNTKHRAIQLVTDNELKDSSMSDIELYDSE